MWTQIDLGQLRQISKGRAAAGLVGAGHLGVDGGGDLLLGLILGIVGQGGDGGRDSVLAGVLGLHLVRESGQVFQGDVFRLSSSLSLDALQAAAPLIATKAEVAKVKEQIQNIEAAGVTYATTEEVLALDGDFLAAVNISQQDDTHADFLGRNALGIDAQGPRESAGSGTILPESLQAAGDCGLCPATQTMDGTLRLYAKEAPATPLRARPGRPGSRPSG